jgi:hypothetical protein
LAAPLRPVPVVNCLWRIITLIARVNGPTAPHKYAAFYTVRSFQNAAFSALVTVVFIFTARLQSWRTQVSP